LNSLLAPSILSKNNLNATSTKVLSNSNSLYISLSSAKNDVGTLSELQELPELVGTVSEHFPVFICEEQMVKTTCCKLDYLSESNMAVPSHDIRTPFHVVTDLKTEKMITTQTFLR
jgi:hypothetical protein